MPTNPFVPPPVITVVNFSATLRAIYTNTQDILLNQDKILANQSRMEFKMTEDFTALMQAEADLKAEVADVGAKVVASTTEMDSLFDALNAALGTGNQTEIDAATMAVTDQIALLKGFGQRLQDAMTRDEPPAPPPGP